MKKIINGIFICNYCNGIFYPVIKHAKNKLHCEANAKNYITKNKEINGINKRTLKMLSTNFCYGGKEIMK